MSSPQSSSVSLATIAIIIVLVVVEAYLLTAGQSFG
jgi:hypothetical protein